MFVAQWRPAWGAFVTSILGIICWDVIGIEGVFFTGPRTIDRFIDEEISFWSSILFFSCKLLACVVAIAGDSSGGIFYP